MLCPECGYNMKRVEAVEECSNCGSRWFIVRTSQKKERIKTVMLGDNVTTASKTVAKVVELFNI